MSIHSEAFDDEVHSKKGSRLKSNCSLGLMTVEQIQNLIANIVKAIGRRFPLISTCSPSLTVQLEIMSFLYPVLLDICSKRIIKAEF